MDKIEIPESVIQQRPTAIKHRQQANVQILLPMIIIGLLIISLAIFLIITSANNFAISYHYANISIVFLILPTLFTSLLFGGLVIALCVGVIKIQEIIPKYSALVEYYAKIITQKLHEVQDDAVEPVFLGKLIIFKISHFLQKIQYIMKHDSENERNGY